MIFGCCVFIGGDVKMGLPHPLIVEVALSLFGLCKHRICFRIGFGFDLAYQSRPAVQGKGASRNGRADPDLPAQGRQQLLNRKRRLELHDTAQAKDA